MSDVVSSRLEAGEKDITQGQDAQHTPPMEPSKPIRPGDTSVGKSVHSSAYKSPMSAMQPGEEWSSHTLADVLGLSPGMRGPSLLLSTLCSRAVPASPGVESFINMELLCCKHAFSPNCAMFDTFYTCLQRTADIYSIVADLPYPLYAGSGSGSGGVTKKHASRQPLLPIHEGMKARAQFYSSQPLPEKPSWGLQNPGQPARSDARPDSSKTSSIGLGSVQNIQADTQPSAERGRQDAPSIPLNKHGSAEGTAALPPPQAVSAVDRDSQEHDMHNNTNAKPLQESQQASQPVSPVKQLSFHLTPTLEAYVRYTPPGAVQPKSSDCVLEVSTDKYSHGGQGVQTKAANQSVEAAQPEENSPASRVCWSHI